MATAYTAWCHRSTATSVAPQRVAGGEAPVAGSTTCSPPHTARAVWGGEQVVLPATGASPPATRWGATEVAVDLWHHAVYAVATGVAYRWLDRR